MSEDDIQDVFRVGLDCMTDRRRKLFLAATKGQDPKVVEMSKTVLQRELEDLEELGILERESDAYRLTTRVARLCSRANVK